MIQKDGAFNSLQEDTSLPRQIPILQEHVPPYIRQQLLVRVYSLLSLQLIATGALCSGRNSPTMQDPQVMILGAFVAVPCLLLITCVRPSFPFNLICLFLFTLGMGIVVAHATIKVSFVVMMEALGLTAAVFVSLTALVMCTGRDLTWLQSWLFVGLATLVGFSVFQCFVYSPWLNVLLSWGGTMVFSGFVLYDTSLLMQRFGPDEAIDACLMLYLDALNLFLSILGMLQSSSTNS